MPKKAKTYGLLLVVLSIWGIIAYRVITTLSPKETIEHKATGKVQFNPKKATATDTFSLTSVTRDPFLGKLYMKPSIKHIPKKTIKKEEIQWPRISYQGLVKKMETNTEQVFVLSINNRQYLAKKGQEIQEVTLLKGNETSIEVRYKNQRKKIERN